MTPARLRLATRGSALALAQADLARAALVAAGIGEVAVVVVRTTGDRRPETPVEAMEGQGWFTAELETALLDGRADAAAHSAKDLPTELAPGLRVAAHLPRADVRDAVVSRGGGGLDGLAAGSTVGTSSVRRAALLGALRPDLRPVPIRGNVDTRLRKLDEGQVDALLLAAAGLDRLGLGERIGERLDPRHFVPAPAQGAVAIEAASGSDAAAACAAADDPPTSAAVAAERALLAELGGGCLLPLGAWARHEDGRLFLCAALVADDGVRCAELAGDPGRPEELGGRVAEQLR